MNQRKTRPRKVNSRKTHPRKIKSQKTHRSDETLWKSRWVIKTYVNFLKLYKNRVQKLYEKLQSVDKICNLWDNVLQLCLETEHFNELLVCKMSQIKLFSKYDSKNLT